MAKPTSRTRWDPMIPGWFGCKQMGWLPGVSGDYTDASTFCSTIVAAREANRASRTLVRLIMISFWFTEGSAAGSLWWLKKQ